jgi:hypothetical protein
MLLYATIKTTKNHSVTYLRKSNIIYRNIYILAILYLFCFTIFKYIFSYNSQKNKGNYGFIST